MCGGGESVAQHILISSPVTHTINLPSADDAEGVFGS
jgi:hypothetical protein